MQRSVDRFLTTHTGSLPRPHDLIQIMFAKQDGIPIDKAAFERRMTEGVQEVVQRQVDLGISVVNDGEAPKPSYATYVKDRLTGFGGTGNTYVFQDLVDFPELAARVFADPGRARRKAPACTGPITMADNQAVQDDLRMLKAAATIAKPVETFMSAASPGVVSLFFRNDYYPSQEKYLYAIADALQSEYEAIAAGGSILQIDCPDLAMGRHVQYASATLAEFKKHAQLHIEALNHAVRNIDRDRMRLHLCWGNYGGPHHFDVPFADIIDEIWKARPNGLSFEAANPRHAHEWAMFETIKVPDGKVLIPGLIEVQSNYIEHPELVAQRLGRYAKLVGKENVIGGCDCGFSIHVGQAAIDPKVAWAKLASLAEGARL
ncbi:MAG: cobalamin-independent methionine synthase II family protein, partial [Xanthobacteraceae bacterium]